MKSMIANYEIQIIGNFLAEVLEIKDEERVLLAEEIHTVFNEEQEIPSLINNAMAELQDAAKPIAQMIDKYDGNLTVTQLLDSDAIGEYVALRDILRWIDELTPHPTFPGRRIQQPTPEEDNNVITDESPYLGEVALAAGDAGGLVDTYYFGEITNDIRIGNPIVNSQGDKYAYVKAGESPASDLFNHTDQFSSVSPTDKVDVGISVSGFIDPSRLNGHRDDLIVNYTQGFAIDNRRGPYGTDNLLNGGERLNFTLKADFQDLISHNGEFVLAYAEAQNIAIEFFHLEADEEAIIEIWGVGGSETYQINGNDLDSNYVLTLGVSGEQDSIYGVSISTGNQSQFGVKEISFSEIEINAYLDPIF